MTRRERLERKLEKRLEWADKAEHRATTAYETARKIGDLIPPGQPILVSHHSEKHHRRDLARIDSNMRKSIENTDLAKHHESKASGIEHALDRSIFSDDSNAVEALQERIAEHEAERERMKTINKLYRKGDIAGLTALGLDLTALQARLKDAHSWHQQPYPAYELQNLGGRITADRKRLDVIKLRRERASKAESTPNGIALEQCQGGYVRVTFAEKPDRSILDALKDAGFYWGSGSWTGKADKLPDAVKELLPVETV